MRKISAGETGPVLCNAFLQRLAGDELHDQIWGRVVRPHIVNRHDMLMHDRRRGAGLAIEPLPRRAAVCQMRREHFDGHHAVQLRVEALKHDSHASATDDLFDFVPPQSPQHFRVRRGREEIEPNWRQRVRW